ncbi:MAG: hypothetical protein ACLTDS_01720 [Bianqueaceae bacterium]
MLQKYVAGEDAKPKLNKLGGAEWSKTKNKVREGVAKLAQDLVALYAAREAKKGYAFSADTVWQKEFEELFPYEETDDQLAAIRIRNRQKQKSWTASMWGRGAPDGDCHRAARGTGWKGCILAPTTNQ